MSALIGGHVDVMFDNASTAMPQASSGTVRAIAVTTAPLASRPCRRSRPSPSKACPIMSWRIGGLSSDRPVDVREKLAAHLLAALQSETTCRTFEIISGTTIASTPEELLAREIERWNAILAKADIKPT